MIAESIRVPDFSGIKSQANRMLASITNIITVRKTSANSLAEVTVTIDSGKHTVRINGVAIESFWREKAANSLADRIRNALSQ